MLRIELDNNAQELIIKKNIIEVHIDLKIIGC